MVWAPRYARTLYQTHLLTSPGMPAAQSNAYVNGNQHAPAPPPQTPQSFGGGAPQHYAFQYSNCSGRRKALLIGINYFGQRGQLRGCINDVKNMSSFLNQAYGYQREDMVILTDDQQNPISQPTKQNILRAMHWLVKDAQPNDSLFFHYSGETAATFRLSIADSTQGMAVKRKISMGTKRMGTTRSSIPWISAKSGISSMTRCTGSWCGRYSPACD